MKGIVLVELKIINNYHSNIIRVWIFKNGVSLFMIIPFDLLQRHCCLECLFEVFQL